MSHQISFSTLHTYDPAKFGIDVPIELRLNNKIVTLTAKLDTGSTFCIFERVYAEQLELDLEKGERELVSTATSHFIVYGHEITLYTLGLEISTTVYFAEDYNIKRSVLGRRGWLEAMRVGIIDYDGKLFVSHYDEEVE